MRRGLTLAALFALVLALGWVQATRPRSAALPVVFSASGNSQVEAAGVVVRIVQVAQVDQLISTSYEREGDVIPTQGTWVAAVVEVEATQRPTGAVVFALEDRFGRTFIPTTRAGDTGFMAQPGERFTLQMAFEVPLDAVPESVADGGDSGLTLRIYPEGIDYYTVGIPMELAKITIDAIDILPAATLEDAVGPETAS